ncbi:hypothetical protein [Kitasatospora azatica]|uniref:hypothetical protein n=1 Tax=Kitasatospora azatica TaxID=58347 RepID=UPI0012F96F93|nr:hypothetical protein [Kitasatospora azatica]
MTGRAAGEVCRCSWSMALRVLCDPCLSLEREQQPTGSPEGDRPDPAHVNRNGAADG